VQTNRSDARVASPSRPDADAAASVAAYAVRLADLIGDDLGMGAVVALELEVGSMRVFVHREPSGKVVGASTVTDADAALYRERWGL
jgi:tartrate dehydratase beta subunit/fumarate hydratase class I family protein